MNVNNTLNTIVSFSHLELTLAAQTILSGVSFSINKGDKVALLGDSGVGKSSLLKLIAGIHQPSKGCFNTNAKRIGYVFQEPRLLPWLTVEQNITEAMKANGISANSIKLKLPKLLSQVELSQYHDYYPHQLSGGMAQRVSLARAFAITPDLLLLDEPFSALDNTLTNQLTRLLKQFLTPEITLIYISHQIEQVLALTQSCVLIKRDPHSQTSTISQHSTATSNEQACFVNQYYQQPIVC
ncbi:hypothetical protein NBRC116592_15030 [Colwellia sp. KU-HH00111]|uniref:ABC transporter ATP-binding protein n=1 Tax=Colwellia sp. KU-HH00111 TaxID=3127652 RepID=UPI00310844FD